MAEEIKEIREYIPAQHIDDEVILTGNGDATIGFELMLPEVFTINGEQYTKLHEEIIGFLKKLPEDTIVHKQDFFYPYNYDRKSESKRFTQQSNNDVFLGRPVMNHYSRIYITFKNERLRKTTAKDNSAVRLFDYVFKQPVKDIPVVVDKARDSIEPMFVELSGIKNLEVKPMKGESLFRAYKEYFELSFDKPGEGSIEGSWSPVEVKEGYVKVGNNYVGVVSLSQQGDTVYEFKKANQQDSSVFGNGVKMESSMDIELGMMFPLGLGLPIKHIVNTTIETKGRDSIFRNLGVTRYQENMLAFLSGAAEEKVTAIDEFKLAVSNQDYKVCKVSVNVIVVEDSLKGLNKNLNIVQTAFNNMNGSVGWVENFEAFPRFVCSSPGYVRANNRDFVTVLEVASCYLCLETHYVSDTKGHVYIDRFGKPVVVDMWDSRHIVNRNKFVIGPSGSGKSFWLNDYMDQSIEKGNHIIIMDVGHSYKELCEASNGLYVDSSNRKQLSFNIFLVDKDDKGHYKLNDDKKLFIYSVLMTIWKGSKKDIPLEMASILKEMIGVFYAYVNKHDIFPVFETFYKFIDIYRKAIEEKKGKETKFVDFDSMKIVFKAYVDGEYKYLLNNKSNIDIRDQKFVVFDIESIEKDEFAFPVVGLVIMELVMDKIRRLKGIKKTFVIDEGWKVLKSDLSDFVEYLYRTFRKNDGEVILATQNVRDIESTGIADALTANSDTKILLDHSANQNLHPDLQRILSITDGDLIKLNDIKVKGAYREFFVKLGNISKLFRMQVSDKTAAVYTSVGKDKAVIRGYFEKYGNLGTAINQYLEDKEKELA